MMNTPDTILSLRTRSLQTEFRREVHLVSRSGASNVAFFEKTQEHWAVICHVADTVLLKLIQVLENIILTVSK